MLVVDLSHHEFVRVKGPDSIAFLQGQVTCNMDLLSDSHSLRGALCNLKGRAIADFRVIKQGDDCLLQTQAEMASTIIETLAKYAVFSKVELTREQFAIKCYGIIGAEDAVELEAIGGALPTQPGEVSHNNNLSVICVSDNSPRFELWCHCEEAIQMLSQLDSFKHTGNLQDWLAADIAEGVVHVSASISEMYTPQLLNYDISGVVDFTKGCYTGQEVVARMFYRGKAKKRLFRVSSDHHPGPGSQVAYRSAEGGQAGEILVWSRVGAEPVPAELLAILNTDDVNNGVALTLSDNPETCLQIKSLPYTE